MPSIGRLYAEYESSGLEVLLVNLGEGAAHVRATTKSRGYRMPVLLDSRGQTLRMYAISGTPTVYLVNRNGLIVGRAVGTRDWAGPTGRAVLEALLQEGR